MSEALWKIIQDSRVDIADMLIFLPSRRAVRTVEKMIADKMGGVAILPKLVGLGEGVDEENFDEITKADIISNTERVVAIARLLAADADVGTVANALPVAADLVRMQDYLENEGVDATQIDWESLVDEKYSGHFQKKAKILGVLSSFMPMYANGRITSTAARNRDIRTWKNVLHKYKLVIVCGSTASVPATADLMVEIAKIPHGRIILSGKISGQVQDFELNTNPYNAEYKFLNRLGLCAEDVCVIDVGPSVMDFMNMAFSNQVEPQNIDTNLSNCHLVECGREAVEANAVAEIAERAIAQNKSVLVITPDAAGNQRIGSALNARGIVVDSSGGLSGVMTSAGRAILNMFDAWRDTADNQYDELAAATDGNLFDTVQNMIEKFADKFMPQFYPTDKQYEQMWWSLKQVSDALVQADVKPDLLDARSLVEYAFAGVSVRNLAVDNPQVVVLGTIESRMQTADVVILTGLNDGMFPAQGYENAWLPRRLCEKIGLPSPDRKVALQSLDFMNLSCGNEVYWLRSTIAGGVQTTESRFLSRVLARKGIFKKNTDIVQNVAKRDDVPRKPLDYSVPTPPADWSDVYVTELEHLIHNPYSFYAKHILRLNVLDDYWTGVDARHFGILVHDVVEHATDLRPDALVAEMDRRALEKIGVGSVMFHFWHKRFLEIAPVIANELTEIQNSVPEIQGYVKIGGRTIRAKADRVWDGGVLDIKTGAAPTESQLEKGNMPQLPLEAYMLQKNGFPIESTELSVRPIMKFLQLKNGDARIVLIDQEKTQNYINAAVAKVEELVNIYSVGGAGYEYRDQSEQKYKGYDDLARVKD